jgi:hypothetical protein
MDRQDETGGRGRPDLIVACVCGHQDLYDLAEVRPDHAYRCTLCGNSVVSFKPSELAALWREREP